MSRFADSQDPVFRALNASIAFDYRLAPYDLRQSQAHARMLCRCEIITEEDLAEIERGLAQINEEVDSNSFEIGPEDEDIHMAIERRLVELLGPIGGKLHTARSRNDQVATDTMMFVRAHAVEAKARLLEVLQTLHSVAASHLDWQMPGYTHLQRAQPVYLSHHLLAYFWKFARDYQRFEFCLTQTDQLPLGAGALAGVNFDTDRMYVARELGFGGVAENSIDAVSNRDFMLDYLGCAATCATHLSQLGGELVLWSSEEFGYCELSDSFASGSSLMPQKKNPDGAELLRAKAPRMVAHLQALYGVLHGLPLTYNKDLQEDKENLFDAVDTLEISLSAAAGMLRGASFDRERLAEAATDEFLAATDIADMLVRRGIAFREAHGIVGSLVRHSIAEQKPLSHLTDAELKSVAPELDEGVLDVLRDHGWLESKISVGGTSLERVREQLDAAGGLVSELQGEADEQ
jgi:argininosuccinate lyase